MLNGTVTSRYRILENIQSHVDGERYLAEDMILGRRVLLHVPPETSVTLNHRQLLTEDIRKAADFSHPNVSAIFDLLEHEGRPVVVCEFIDGIPLPRFVEETDYTLEDALNIAIQLSDAVRSAHKKQVFHGSLCSRSVSITSGNCVKVADFGLVSLAKVPADRNSSGNNENVGSHDLKCLVETIGMLLNDRVVAFAKHNPRLGEMLRDITKDGDSADLDVSDLLTRLLRARELHRVGPLDERYQLATASGQIAVWDYDLDAGRVYMDPSLKAMVGFDDEEIENTLDGWRRLIHPDDLQKVVRAAESCMNGDTDRYEIAHRRIHRNGQTKWFLTRGSIVRNDQGRPVRMVGTDTDVTELTRTQQALHLREQQLRAFIKHIPLAVAMFDRDMRYVAASERWLMDRGLVGTDVRGQSHYDLLPDMPDDWRQVHQRCLAGATEKCEEAQFTKPDGSVEWIRWEVHPWYETDGGVGGIIIFWEEITQRKLAEEKLRESEERFRTLAELSPDTIVVHIDGKVAFVNEAGVRMLGAATREQIVGQPVMDFVHPDFRETIHRRIGQVVGEGKTAEFMEQKLVALDGRVVDVEAGSKPLTLNGKPAVQVVARDVSERIRAQEALRKSEAQYRGVIEDQTEMICRFSPDTAVTFVNDAVCRYFSKTREELIGKSFLPFVPEQDRELVKAAIASLTPDSPVSGVEHRIRLESGESRWHQWTNRAIFDKDKKLIGYQAVGRDITERKRADNMLKVTMRKLRAQRRQLTDSNLALKQVLDHIERERQDYKRRLCQDIEMALSPLIAQLRSAADLHLQDEIDAVERAMKSTLTKDIDVFRDRYSSLTSRELEVCELIKKGRTSKEMADELRLSLLTIHKHREQIRKKLGLKNKGVNLSTYLKSR